MNKDITSGTVQIDGYEVSIDADGTLLLLGQGQCVYIDAYQLLDYLAQHREQLAAVALRSQMSDYQSQESPESRRNGYGAEERT